MREYDDYSPHIYYNDEEEQISDARQNDTLESPKRTRRRGKPSVQGKECENVASKKRKRNQEAVQPSFFEGVKAFFTSRTTAVVTGIILAGFAAYCLIAFVSYVGACISDQSVIANHEFGSIPKVQNQGGEGGARLSEFLINGGFGLSAFVLIIWLICISLKLLIGRPRFRTLDFTLKCLIGFITVSLIIGLFTIGSNTIINWGGYHGRYVNEWIIGFFGWAGAIILCVVMVALFVVISMRDVVKWIIVKKTELDAKRKAMMEERALRRQKERELEEQKRQEQELEAQQGSEIESDRADLGRNGVSFNETLFYPETQEEVESSYRSAENGNEGDHKSDIMESPSETAAAAEGSAGEEDGGSSNDSADGSKEQEEGSSSSSGGNTEEEAMVVNVNQIAKSDSPDQHKKARGSLYKFPSVDLMIDRGERIIVDPDEQLANEEKIRQTLLDYDVPILSIEAHVGPTVTLYEIRPDKGNRISKIKNLVDEIALSLAAKGVRIIAPIPGKGTIGIEVANDRPQTVSMRSIIESKKYQETRAALPIALGSTISNEVYIADLASIPHLLVAGATGQGKSVGLNVIIMSLLYKKRPDELKFVMFDPKMVEFNLYAAIQKQYLAKLPEEEEAIVTDMNKVVPTLNSLCIEMDNRYALLKEAEVRKMDEYNKLIKSGKFKDQPNHRFLPYIVVVIDEFADLIMTAGKEVEMPIARLAQKARAVGIHVIIATQRPSVQVITGLIKSNFPGRMAFKVSQGNDSKVILDTTGAQQLIGKGDMLISNNSELVRVQCAFLDTPEVKAICEHIGSQPAPIDSPYILPEPNIPDVAATGVAGGKFTGDKDPLYDEIRAYVVMSGTASTSNIQRKYEIGYNRAGRIMDQLEAEGVVGPSQGGKPRAVLVNS